MKPSEALQSPEFNLVLACLCWPQETVDGDRIRLLAQQPLNWPHVLAMVRHHKVVPLFFRNLDFFAADSLPHAVATALRSETAANNRLCTQRITQLCQLCRLFRHQQMDLRIFKGIPLAFAAFGDATLRDAGDIDLLVSQKDLFEAGEILRSEGYFRFEPQARLTPRRLRSYIAHQKDFSYEHPLAGVVIDLHWRLFRNAWLPGNADIDHVGEEWLDLGAEQAPTLAAPRQLLYLSLHGALDGWLRLKWLADIGALLHTMNPEQLAATVELATRERALPQLSAALLLCHDLLGPHPIPDGCLNRTDKQVARILQFGKKLITSNNCCPVREKIPSTQWFFNEWRLHASLRYRIDLLQRSLFRPRVWRWCSLPDALFPLYALLSPLEWIVFHLRRRLPAQQPRPGRAKALSLRKLRQFSVRDLSLAVEAVCMLIFFRLALKFLPMEKLTGWMSAAPVRQPSMSAKRQARILGRVEWSIDAAARHAPLTFVCFPQCLAAYFMLRRRRIASTLFYGVTRDDAELKAHTWVKVGDRTIGGGNLESRFTVLATFP